MTGRNEGAGDRGSPFPADCAEKFEAVRRLGGGGFGDVYLATQRGLGRPVAVKLLHAEALDGENVVDRFLEEARITASVRHPNVVEVLDFGARTGAPWIAYELLEGRNLREELAAGAFAPGRAIEAARQAADGLEAAHALGVIHRDVKPENILVCGADGGEILYKVVDFGAAKWGREGAVRTQAGLILGTPAYLSPERIRGEPATPAADVYALGIMLFELIAGEPPYREESAVKLLEKHLRAPVPSLRGRVRGIPAALERVVNRALAKDPGARFPSAGAMRDELEGISASGSGAVPGGSGVSRAATTILARPLEGPAKPVSRRRAGAFLLVLAGTGILLASRSAPPRAGEPRISPSAVTSITASPPAPSRPRRELDRERIEMLRPLALASTQSRGDLERIPDLTGSIPTQLEEVRGGSLDPDIVVPIVKRYRELLDALEERGGEDLTVLAVEELGFALFERIDARMGTFITDSPTFSGEIKKSLQDLASALAPAKKSWRRGVLEISLRSLADRVSRGERLPDRAIATAARLAAERVTREAGRRGWTPGDRAAWILMMMRSLRLPAEGEKELAHRRGLRMQVVDGIRELARALREDVIPDRLAMEPLRLVRPDLDEVLAKCVSFAAGVAADAGAGPEERGAALEAILALVQLVEDAGERSTGLTRDLEPVLERLENTAGEAARSLRTRIGQTPGKTPGDLSTAAASHMNGLLRSLREGANGDWNDLLGFLPKYLEVSHGRRERGPAISLARLEEDIPGQSWIDEALVTDLTARSASGRIPMADRSRALAAALRVAVSLGEWWWLSANREDEDGRMSLLVTLEGVGRRLALEEEDRRNLQRMLSILQRFTPKERRRARYLRLELFQLGPDRWVPSPALRGDVAAGIEALIHELLLLLDCVPGVAEWGGGVLVAEPAAYDLLDRIRAHLEVSPEQRQARLARWRPGLEALRERLGELVKEGRAHAKLLQATLVPPIEALLRDEAHMVVPAAAAAAWEAAGTLEAGEGDAALLILAIRTLLVERAWLHAVRAPDMPGVTTAGGTRPPGRAERGAKLGPLYVDLVGRIALRVRAGRPFIEDPFMQACPAFPRIHENSPVYLGAVVTTASIPAAERRVMFITLIDFLHQMPHWWARSQVAETRRVVGEMIDGAVGMTDPPLDREQERRLERILDWRRKALR